LTAAHCVVEDGKLATGIRIISGNVDRTKGELSSGYALFVHPKFNETTLENDIALVQLPEEALRITPLIPITDSKLNEDLTSSFRRGILFGWGAKFDLRILNNLMSTSTDYLSEEELEEIRWPKLLQQVEVTIFPAQKCFAAYAAAGLEPKGKNLLCAGAVGKGACEGDSGGPLLVLSDQYGYVQVGVASYQRYCAEPGLPTVYTRVSDYYTWIEEITHSRAEFPTSEHRRLLNAPQSTPRSSACGENCTVIQKQ
jgi:secreted trypsin-like serine protease